MEQDNGIIIKYVAQYLRKSRGESEQDLYKHEKELNDLCIKNNWKYIQYKEIGSGDSISDRPVMQQLLLDIEAELFDAVAVIDIDRLGRGDLGDQDRIKKAFAKSETSIVTPSATYNLNNENDEFTVDMRSFIARIEYKQIVKRLLRGKKIGSKLGQWTNGTPPFPYSYERYKNKYNPKGIVVNDDNLPVYRSIIDMLIHENKTPHEIAWSLNTQGILSPRGTSWYGEVIRRLITDETHLGKIISNKTSGDGHKRKKSNSKELKLLPKEQWNIVENCHEAVKTQEEHEKILMFLHRKTKAPSITSRNIYPLSSLIKCGLCGHTMQIISRADRKNNDSIKPCWYRDKFGNKCENHGGLAINVYNAINERINAQEELLNKRIQENSGQNNIGEIEIKIAETNKQISSQNKTIDFIYEQYEKGIYDETVFASRREKAEKELCKLETNLDILELELKHIQMQDNEKKLENLIEFKGLIFNDTLSNLDLNNLYKSIINYIIYTREKVYGDIDIDINFK